MIFPSKGTKIIDILSFLNQVDVQFTGNTVCKANISDLNKYALVKCINIKLPLTNYAKNQQPALLQHDEGFRNQFVHRYFGHPWSFNFCVFSMWGRIDVWLMKIHLAKREEGGGEIFKNLHLGIDCSSPFIVPTFGSA